jgi:hypothetical protein
MALGRLFSASIWATKVRASFLLRDVLDVIQPAATVIIALCIPRRIQLQTVTVR